MIKKLFLAAVLILVVTVAFAELVTSLGGESSSPPVDCYQIADEKTRTLVHLTLHERRTTLTYQTIVLDCLGDIMQGEDVR